MTQQRTAPEASAAQGAAGGREPGEDAGTATVSVIGLGQLGTRLAQAFLAAGHPTTVWNRTPAKADALVAQGAARAAGLEAAVAASPLVVVCLPDYATVRGLVEPVAGALRGRVLVNLTSGTPQDATKTAHWAAGHGIGYLDGAAMSGTRLVGRPDALFVFGGPAGVFAAHREVLGALGNSVHVGDDPAQAPVYDTALFGAAWGALAGFYHSIALAGAAGADLRTYAEVVTGHMGFVTSLMADHARQIEEGRYPSDDGTVEVHRAAMDHLVHTSRAGGVGTEVPELFGALLAGAEGAGHGGSGIASVVEGMRAGADTATTTPAAAPAPNAKGRRHV
ncbi:NAD(P)-binding domain-containing protein [Streptomyces sp. C11-1]|uniref:NAD(P)-binding domain-containing protein n=1 Tax=Streptomyces durocortorensis TaxID=2811104 RepID=A0ABY9VUN8_9ACTN|nr:NAD(P)-binding domain-containing protein [Streptomyces durocortorensis]WNF27634.1 NAD(P)-binding domain-containing protein [Streptomyces durocortorensis]